MGKIKILTTVEEIKAISDPYRLKILIKFINKGEPATVKQIADDMGEVPSKVYYHVKKLEKIDILKLSYTKEINGIVAKYYEPTAEEFTVDNDELTKSNSIDYNQNINNKQILISTLYDNSKKFLLNEVSSSIEKKIKPKASITSSNIYMTDDEAKDFFEYTEKFLASHSKKQNDSEKSYHIFTALCELK